MRLSFTESAWQQYLQWQETDPRMVKRINLLIKEIIRDPLSGTGKPEPLRHEWSGWWSRRLDREHRLVYRVNEDSLIVAQCRFHY